MRKKLIWLLVGVIVVLFVSAAYLAFVKEPKDGYPCNEDSDCIKVTTGPCGTYPSLINKRYSFWWAVKHRWESRGDEPRACPLVGIETGEPRCVNDKCVFGLLDATADMPIVIANMLEMKRNSAKELEISFYNRAADTAVNAILEIGYCQDKNRIYVEDEKKLDILSAVYNVQSKQAVTYNTILTEKGLPEGTYICEIGAKCQNDCPAWLEDQYYETRQFFLTIVS